MKRLISQVLILSLLLQPLASAVPVLAERVKMEYTNPSHIHAPHQVTVDGQSTTYEYDANGNLTFDGERTIEWNEDNLPVKISKGNTEVRLYYDAQGRRIVKSSTLKQNKFASGQELKVKSGEEQETKTVYVNQYYQLSVIGNQLSVTKYYFAQGRRIATNHYSPTTTHQPFTNHQQLITNFIHHDHLGSTILTTNLTTDSTSQPPSSPLSYFPYGNSINNQQLFTNHQQPITNYLYTGQELDPESDLYNYNARLYNPKTGVFISADTVGGGNRYAYANNNPMMFVDPSGRDAWTWVARLFTAGKALSTAANATFWAGVSVWMGGVFGEGLTNVQKETGTMPNILATATGFGPYYSSGCDFFGSCPISETQYNSQMEIAETLKSTGNYMVYASSGLAFLGEASQFAGSVLGYWRAGKESKYFTRTGEPTERLLEIRQKLLSFLDQYKTRDIKNIYVVGSQVTYEFKPETDLDILMQPEARDYEHAIIEMLTEQCILEDLNPKYTDDDMLDFLFKVNRAEIVRKKGPFIHLFSDLRGPFPNEPAFDLINLRWVRKPVDIFGP